MRVEKVDGEYMLVGAILPVEKIAPGQVWARADGAPGKVVIDEIENEYMVFYRSIETGAEYKKDWFNFQCRYCLVLKSNEIPKWVNA